MSETPQRVTRCVVPALDEVLGVAFPVLDQGFVRIVDYMGTDDAVVQAARVSYGAGTKRVQEDRGLIRYLMRHSHTTPFEMCEIKLHLRVPMDVWRQWIRHRTASVNEYSTRYSIAIDAALATKPQDWRLQATHNRQGSSGFLDQAVGEKLTAEEAEIHDHCRKAYNNRLGAGVAREQARKDLPLSTYTEAYWKIDLHNLLHFLDLRMAPQAQFEIRQYASVIGREILSRWCPITWEAFLDFRLAALSLSAIEVRIVSASVRGDDEEALSLAESLGWSRAGSQTQRLGRELAEAEEKIRSLGLTPIWRKQPPE
jgi:thymidylate synthase (FAD)